MNRSVLNFGLARSQRLTRLVDWIDGRPRNLPSTADAILVEAVRVEITALSSCGQARNRYLIIDLPGI